MPARRADRVLAGARVFDNVAEAVADCAHVYATTVRKRGVTKPVLTPEAAAQEMHRASGRSAILFGPERSGLETDDVAVARAIVTVPVNPAFASLNLAQAGHVRLRGPKAAPGVAARWRNRRCGILPPAPQETRGVIAHSRMLEAKNYFFPPWGHRHAAHLSTMLTSRVEPPRISHDARRLSAPTERAR